MNLGLLNVNPLVSLQVSKNEHGEKLLKPFVNLHVTPNENIIGKIGSLFAAKKHKLSHHHHEHNHLHRYPSYPPPIHHGPPHFESFPHGPPPHFESFPHGPPNFQSFPHGPPPPFYHDHHEHHHQPHFNGPPPGHFLSRPPHPFYKDAGTLHEDSGYDGNSHDLNEFDFNPTSLGFRNNNATQSIGDFPLEDTENQEFKRNYNYQSFYPQNSNNAINQNDGQQYANNYANYNTNSNQFTQSLPIQAPGQARGSDTVSFPNSRRKRDTDQVVPASIEKESLESIEAEGEEGSEGRALTAEKVSLLHFQSQIQINQV